ncbi:helix-turn-helix transcriptional regulator [Henriciella mobilis]|uniref:LuxR family transcriptional regulator n=1 Tax=Henriciella mobilis TaxID=2305467 RepID=A0A399RF80_9PROT|nr:LuxR family transcriptional regulator [Henriciella mobilis]RIJ28462.1 LuxR family transcriptional regulator [Henriciella mobilis]
MELLAYLEAVSDCQTKEALDEVLIDTCNRIGVAALSGYNFPVSAYDDDQRLPIISTWPDSVRAVYRDIMVGDDPIMNAAMALGIPVHFRSLTAKMDLNEKGQTFVAAMFEAGLVDGVITPVISRPGSVACFAAAFDEQRDDIRPSELRRIKFLFSEYYFRYRELTDVRVSELSVRERQVMVAIVNAKSNPQIARELGVSEHTVGTYVRRCFEKLDVNNRTQAIVRFLGGGAGSLPSS